LPPAHAPSGPQAPIALWYSQPPTANRQPLTAAVSLVLCLWASEPLGLLGLPFSPPCLSYPYPDPCPYPFKK